MSNDRFPISPKGHKKLELELQTLKTVERPAIINAIAEARAHGDLSENAEYSAAKEKQGFIEAKILDLESKLSRAHVIDPSTIESDHVQFGAFVRIIDEETEEEIEYTLVSDYEADLEKKHISIASPVAKALMGKKVSDSIEVNTPKGVKYYEILHLEYKSY
jgi:transcription elongation factor GreA